MFRKLNRWLLRRTGYRIAKESWRGLPASIVEDPRLAPYHDPGSGRGCAVFAPAARGLGFNAFALGPDSYHPWVLAARRMGASGRRSDIAEVLRIYYSLVQPARLGEWLDIPAGSCGQIEALPLHAWSVLPWSVRDPKEALKAIESAQLEENRQYGLDEGMSAGRKAFGPISESKLSVETTRIGELFESMKAGGFDHTRPDYDLRATFLVSGHRWSWLSMGGMHRVAMASAVGNTEIPVRVAAVVRREDVEVWPQVTSGLYDKGAALRVFDRLLDLRPPACTTPWLEWVDEHRLA